VAAIARLFPAPADWTAVSDLDPETFDARKYAEDFAKLERAYKNAFETMNDEYDSELVHAIDQRVLAESEPFYEESAERRSADDSSGQGPRERDGEFRIELPEEPSERLEGYPVDREKFEVTLERYVEELESEIARTFNVR